MRLIKKFVLACTLMLPWLCLGQAPLLRELESTGRQKISPVSLSQFDQFVHTLGTRHAKSEKELLKTIFRKTQHRYLKSYAAYVDFPELFSTGRYDCLTATALYTLILNELNYKFDIIETNYHIFLLVHLTKGKVLLETTDRISGYVDNPQEIEERIGVYKNGMLASSAGRAHQYTFNLQQEVRPEQLTSLLYFNQAVNAFNQHDLLACANLLDKSCARYESPRVGELAAMLVQSVLQSNLENELKYSLVQRYKRYLLPKASLLASR